MLFKNKNKFVKGNLKSGKLGFLFFINGRGIVRSFLSKSI